jgi:hypothetical protein
MALPPPPRQDSVAVCSVLPGRNVRPAAIPMYGMRVNFSPYCFSALP